MVEVGMYWRLIKGRFGSRTSRTYLAMKYGYRWLNRIKVKKVDPQTISSAKISVSNLAQKVAAKLEALPNATASTKHTNESGFINKMERLA